MKKLLIGIALLLCLGLDGFCSNGSGIPDKETKMSIVIISGGKPLPRPRSGIHDSIEIFVNKEFGVLSVLFAEEFGVVTVSVKNSMGMTVAAAQCDTSLESAVVLDVPTTEDTYMLSIVGSEIEAVGYYDL